MKVIGIDIGGTKIRAGLVVDSVLAQAAEIKTASAGTEREVVEQIIALIAELWDSEVTGIGVGVPAIVDVDKGVVYETVQIPSWRQVPLKKILEDEYKISVFLNNDSNCFALAEKVFGGGQGYEDIAAVTMGSGLGVGLIIGGKLHYGHNCGAGEFGRIVYQDKRLTDYCSGKFFQREYASDGVELLAQAQRNDQVALEAFSRFGWHVGKALSIMVHSVDPQIIILGGGIARAYDFFQETMQQSLKESVYERSYSRLQLAVSTLEDSAVLGAAALCEALTHYILGHAALMPQ